MTFLVNLKIYFGRTVECGASRLHGSYRTVPCGILDYKTGVFDCFANLLGVAEKGSKSRFAPISDEKGLVQQAIFEKKIVTAIISGKVQGVVGGGENTFSPHDFFLNLFFIFLFSPIIKI